MEILPILQHVFSLQTLILTTFGTLLGIALGAAPGLNGPIGVALLLPLTYNLDPADGLLMLGGIYMGATYGGSISAILLNCPGTGEATCTALDGYPLARQGRAKAALYFSINASSIGGIAGVAALIFLTPWLAGIALKFGPPEMLVVALSGLTIVGGLSGKKPGRAMFAAAFGVLLSMVGADITAGGYRFTFGFRDMRSGVSLIPIVVGLFAITEMIMLLVPQERSMLQLREEKISLWQAVKETLSYWKILIRSTLLGLYIGILPGTGGAVAAFVAYGEAKRVSKHPEKFGQGAPEGVIGPEAANNAAVGGSLIPLLALGIPGSATAAIIYGALTIHNLIPGPNLMLNNPHTVYTFTIGMLLIVVVMFVCGAFGVKLFATVLRIPDIYLASAVLVFTTIGVYSVRNNLFDLLLAYVFGILGIFFRKLSIPPAPLLLGHILGPLVEENLARCVILAGAQGSSLAGYVLMRPISGITLAICGFLAYTNFKHLFQKKKAA
ncbi:MAG: tripartite tricarboxylate transporter permease [Planctomycetes bacterium]|nr:tripartite tricarboxylate transporter permease [Planctomycetota bacterium]